MKKKMMLVSIVLLMGLLTGCMSNYAINTYLVDPKPVEGNVMAYEDNIVKIDFKPYFGLDSSYTTLRMITIDLENKSDETIKITWDDGAFVSLDKTTTGIEHGMESQKSNKTIIPAGAVVKVPIKATTKVYDVLGTKVSTDLLFSISNKEIEQYNGENMSLLLPIQISDDQKEYRFDFRFEVGKKN